jgi:rare lipoprotein A (peptidoglycan hydrolase)
MERGVARSAFDQQFTANGEIFDLNQLTAAHRTAGQCASFGRLC